MVENLTAAKPKRQQAARVSRTYAFWLIDDCAERAFRAKLPRSALGSKVEEKTERVDDSRRIAGCSSATSMRARLVMC